MTKSILQFKFSFILLIFSFPAFCFGQSQEQIDHLQKLISPHIEGDTLFIEGRIDSHIYDYLMYEAVAVKKVKFIELNSFGGNNDWGLETARKIKELGVTTRLREGKFCASACVYLFAAGISRQAEKQTWLGIHGARLGAGYTSTFQGLCFIDLDDETSQFFPKKKDCQSFLDHWYAITLNATLEAFHFMESSGVSPRLWETYFNMPDDENWPLELNVLRKPDWPITAEEALSYQLVTDLI